ncbi:hypothetical protein SIAM614_16967 [Stappia aggregata IAM 12614]|jgi:hypothetical protein|uniref:Uncharacterized protein n=1 Tax=Roseibium aggregatum (strain ATCC 25650 / DSM 13394 / JCM 20685 / NBRC 16684 / NCIMB 2208 / IAM 12614 / B1) TaxID=384765 RepID=A0P2Z9_ROSAI|nr:hypothetical protein SIAM614_16967 [Stappia aggregata IAM 12614] [Roseibium aggregatum IAM 12614]
MPAGALEEKNKDTPQMKWAAFHLRRSGTSR